jgi:hypothetical protein
MKLKVFSQLPYAEKGGRIDDCGPSALAAAIYHSSGGAENPKVDGTIAAAAKAGRVDKEGSSEGTTFEQIVKAAKFLGATLTIAPTWAKAVAEMKNGKAVCVAFRAAIATPPNAISAWQRGSMKRHPGHTYAHYATLAIVDGQFVFADPTMSGKGAEEFGVVITEAEAKMLAHWGIAEVNAKRKTPMAWICTTKTKAVAPTGPEETDEPATIVVEAPRKPVEAPKVESGTKTPSELDSAMKALEKVDWASIGAKGLALAGDAAEAAKKEKTIMGKIGAWLKYIADNSKIDEMLLDAVRTFLTVSISVALGLGIPLLDISGGDFRTILSAGLASALQILVKALDPNSTEYGIQKKK